MPAYSTAQQMFLLAQYVDTNIGIIQYRDAMLEDIARLGTRSIFELEYFAGTDFFQSQFEQIASIGCMLSLARLIFLTSWTRYKY